MFKKIYRFFELIGYARAASALAQMGKIKEAKSLMLNYQKAKKTYNELSALNDKELKDIGISRSDITRISFGEKHA